VVGSAGRFPSNNHTIFFQSSHTPHTEVGTANRILTKKIDKPDTPVDLVGSFSSLKLVIAKEAH
jgi:hypothetical protein